MEDNNTVITIDSIDEYREKEFCIDINENLEPPFECCIYKVPKDLRKLKEEAYTPQLISIGPLHYGKEELRDMEKQKKRYKREFISKRINIEIWQIFIRYIEINEKFIRNCYAEMPKFPKLKFLTMVLYDAVFIIELLLRFFERTKDFLLDKPRIEFALANDLILLENQLPYFVLKELYRLASPNLHNSNGQPYPSLFSLSMYLFDAVNVIPTFEEVVEIKHFTDLVRRLATQRYPKPQQREGFRDLPCSVKLQESGVTFKGTKGCWLDIRFERKKLRIPWFKVNELQIPHIEIDDRTEIVFRNIMALEQCHYPSETLICNYIDLMDNLINTEEDVNLLVDSKIITNGVGDTATIAKMFNKLCLNITLNESCYGKLEKDLKKHHNNRWNHATATLKRVYFNNYWRGTGTMAAVVLLLLTLIQTICSIKQVV